MIDQHFCARHVNLAQAATLGAGFVFVICTAPAFAQPTPCPTPPTQAQCARPSPPNARAPVAAAAGAKASVQLPPCPDGPTPAQCAHTGSPATVAPVSAAGDAKSDKSGTNPLNLQRTFALSNEFDGVNGTAHIDMTRLRYTEAFAPNFSVRLELPFVAAYAAFANDSAVGGGNAAASPSDGGNLGKSRDFSRFGLGDMVLKTTYIPFLDHTGGVALSAELGMPTASYTALGTGKWTFSPSITYGMFLSPTMILAPSYKQSFSIAGDAGRKTINNGAIDLYYVIILDKTQSITIDPMYLPDYNAGNYAGAALKVNYSHFLAKVGDGALNGYIKPGIGIGQDKPYGWSIEAGVTLIGF